MTKVECFLDTNVLIYASNGRLDLPEKHAVAQTLLVRNFGTSSQVLAEFYANSTSQGSKPLPEDLAREWVANLARKPCMQVDHALVLEGIDISNKFRITYRDGAIVAAARRIGAPILYSENLNHGEAYGSVRVCNPFIEDLLEQTN